MDFGKAASFAQPALSNIGLIRPLSNWDSLLASPEASENSIASNPSANQPAKALANLQVPHCGHTLLLCHSCLSACCEHLVPICRLQLCTAVVQSTGRMSCTFMCFHLHNIALSGMPGRHPCIILLCMLLQQNHCKYWQLSCCVHAKTNTVLCHGEGCNFG